MNIILVPIVTVIIQTIIIVVLLRKMGNSLIQNIGAGLNEIMSTPTIKKAFGILGSQGGNTQSVHNIEAKIAKGFIDKNYGMIKIVADKVLGIDVDEMIDEYGAGNIMAAMQNMLPQLGIDPKQLLAGGSTGGEFDLNSILNPSSGSKRAWYE